MFGFSIQKLLFTILVIVIVWYGFKMLARLQERRDGGNAVRRPASRRAARRKAAPTETDAEDMVACAACGAFVAARRPRSCGRDDCPYPG